MKLTKTYPNKFAPSTIARYFIDNISNTSKYTITIEKGDEKYQIENFEEFCFMLNDAIKTHKFVNYRIFCFNESATLIHSISSYKKSYGYSTDIDVNFEKREGIELFINRFELLSKQDWVDQPIPQPKEPSKIRPRVFIGHGGNSQWVDLKSHLQDQHDIDVVAFETGARAGHTIRDIVKDMSETSDFALLVMTGEDEHKDGRLAPRLNVVHEAGIFQGVLGFERAIILLENGTSEFSNISGIQQIRFNKGNIRETYGDVLATLRREKLLIV